MVFSSMIFIWLFLPITIVLYYILPQACKNTCLLTSSLIFYAWGEPVYILLMLLSILFNWIIGLLIHTCNNSKKIFLIIDIIFNIGVLGYYKYSTFLVQLLNTLLKTSFTPKEIPLPLGISFFTFQILSYIIDLYRNQVPVQKNLLKLALYISFFPQLIAGPIVRYSSISDQIENRELSYETFAFGTRRFIYGLSKKVIIANILATTVDKIYSLDSTQLTSAYAWVASIFYSLQIYYDFSGYSDMAIGLGKMFGFSFDENFNYPYTSFSIQDFWRKWHISLSTWFREYLYIPLGGNRNGIIRTYINLLIVFFVTGFWHGAGYTFIIWGIFHGFFSILERMWLGKHLHKKSIFSHIYSLLVINYGWIIFRSESLTQAMNFFRSMTFFWKQSATDIAWQTLISNESIFIVFIAIVGCGFIQSLFNKSSVILKIKYSLFELLYCSLLFFICIAILASKSYNPFIYFRF